jgi:fermentation-respiration switch protein FrsA (DUF1100 family)
MQGQGETPGTAITFGLRESADVVAAIAWIKKEAPARRVGVLGCSQGGAAALLALQPLGVTHSSSKKSIPASVKQSKTDSACASAPWRPC